MNNEFDVSVVIPTYNRCEQLPGAIESLIAQDSDRVRYEVIVVDNNSTDRTRQVVESFCNADVPVRYVFDRRPGASFARNAGITEANAPIVAFIDDDIRVHPSWMTTLKEKFDAHPEIGFIGGKVLPSWNVTPPHWLTTRHWMPLGLQDHGNDELVLEPVRVTGLISANLAVRRTLLEQVGMFSPKLQLVKGDIGGMEDHELVERMWRAGIIGMYVPQLISETPVDRERTRKKYHRRWHKGHGRNYAVMREERMETSSWYLLGVPAHLYRQAIENALGLIKHWVKRQEELAFFCEVQLWFFYAFWMKRVQDVQTKTTSL